ncbi:PREDICTED: killer cell lectin-like receptor subfamily F member 1 [Chrysochloris asiatica]|uniref:Killer cell lectin-like receptor subfamily F member 1 n=1 Tax=Chrysochloris asiatica TaxID=185453 RepID=A0A9B0U3G6_CHRAS|nr:PREDICTED: killer cell lectin-like receptor subfamily F member 1 [Chrysochloris asiatica]
MHTSQDYPECPKWHQTALRVTSTAVGILVATVIGLTIWISHLSRHPLSDNNSEKVFGIENGSKYCNCTHIPPSKYQDNTNSAVNSKLKLCRDDWLQKKGKCYKFYRVFESWISSQKFCSVKRAHLLMIQDKAELDFIQRNIQDGIYFWIGLNTTDTSKTWTWLDGNPLNLQLFQVTGQTEENACALITKKGVFSEKCSTPSYWICQEVISSST